MHVPKLGDVVAGRYELTGELGRGGFGVVYQATQIGMNRPVALKVLLPQAASEDTVTDRFVREAQLAKNLVHPNTIQLYDFGETDGGCLYIAMEFLEGQTLDDLIKQEGQLPMDRTVHIAQQILKSLAEAHEHGIVHRDLKPANIFMRELVGEKDFVKVLDFGIAKALNLDGAEQQEQLTKTGSSFGTPSYMAPEQIRGTKIGPHTDLYALGLIMAKMLTGHTTVEGGTPIETAALQLSNHPVALPDWLQQSALGGVFQKALAKDFEQRYRSAGDMLEDLQRVSAQIGGPGANSGVVNVPPGGTPPTGQTPPSGQFVYSGQFEYNQLSGPVPMPGQAPQQQKSAAVPILIVVILLLLVGGAAGVYFFVIAPGDESGEAQAQTTPEEQTDEPENSPEDGQTQQPAEDLSELSNALPTGADEGTPDPEEEGADAEPEAAVMVEVEINSNPPGAVVKEGAQVLGTTPMTASFEEGSGVHKVSLSGFGYEPADVEIDVANPEPVEVELEKVETETASARDDRDKDRDRDRDRKKDRDKDRDRDRKKDRDKDEDKDGDTDSGKKPSIPLPD